jgi:hypothetical protein
MVLVPDFVPVRVRVPVRELVWVCVEELVIVGVTVKLALPVPDIVPVAVCVKLGVWVFDVVSVVVLVELGVPVPVLVVVRVPETVPDLELDADPVPDPVTVLVGVLVPGPDRLGLKEAEGGLDPVPEAVPDRDRVEVGVELEEGVPEPLTEGVESAVPEGLQEGVQEELLEELGVSECVPVTELVSL